MVQLDSGAIILITCGNLIVALSLAHVQDEYVLDLEATESTQLEMINCTSPEINLILVCQGSDFNRTKWTSSADLSGLPMTHSNDGLTLGFACPEERCEPIEFNCSGWRKQTENFLELSILVYPRCGNNSSTEVNAHTNIGDRLPENESESQIAYLGIIIGFSVCLILGLLSGVIVFLQKKCNSRSCIKLCGSNYCAGYRPAKRTEENVCKPPPSVLPIMRFHRFKQGSSQPGAHEVEHG